LLYRLQIFKVNRFIGDYSAAMYSGINTAWLTLTNCAYNWAASLRKALVIPIGLLASGVWIN